MVRARLIYVLIYVLTYGAVASAAAAPLCSRLSPRHASRPNVVRLRAEPSLDALDEAARTAHILPAPKLLELLRVAPFAGLSPDAVAERRALVGPNSLPSEQRVSFWRLALAQLDGGLQRALLLAAFVSLAAALLDPTAAGTTPGPHLAQALAEPATILSILLLNALVGAWLENSAADALEALRALQPVSAAVVRSAGEGERAGTPRSVDASELVPGDILLLRPGDAVPADCRLLGVAGLAYAASAAGGAGAVSGGVGSGGSEVRAEQAALTGEPEAVSKCAAALPANDLGVELQGRCALRPAMRHPLIKHSPVPSFWHSTAHASFFRITRTPHPWCSL